MDSNGLGTKSSREEGGPMTGRIDGTVGARTAYIVYGRLTPERLSRELQSVSDVDLAHLVMLCECGLIDKKSAGALIEKIQELKSLSFAPLQGRPAPRGIYLMYEGYLVDCLGPEIGGRLHTARSRNDLRATTTAMALRDWAGKASMELDRLIAILLSRARSYRSVVMPIYTHFQAAMPVSYGYYLTGIALALNRDAEALAAAAEELRNCPLGAGAVAGTDLPIDTARTAELLGFSAGVLHAVDAVAATDNLLRLTSVAASITLTLSRVATDLQLWSTKEFGFLDFPDRLVGGSSAMPQKRNVFLLEVVRGKSAAAVAAWTGTATATKSVPFTNSIESGTSAAALADPGLIASQEAVELMQVLVSGARPQVERMRSTAEAGFITATVIADRLVKAGIPFRSAHEQVGAAVKRAVGKGTTRLDGKLPHLTSEEAMDQLQYGGGPAGADSAFNTVLTSLRQRAQSSGAARARLRDSERALQVAVTAIGKECNV